MINLGKYVFNEDQIISCVNFLKNSDVIFSGTLSESDFKKFNFQNTKIVSKQNGLITFINLEFDIGENDVVYCHLDYLEVLFRMLKNLKYQNIKIISTQSDRKVKKFIFKQKPICISEWYSVNVDFKDENLIPIPLGIASYRNTKSVIFEDFLDIGEIDKINNSFYTNFNENTNYFHRVKAKKSIFKYLGQNIIDNIDYSSYLKNLKSSTFALAPWGNGYDTHRFWESLYSGTVPITISNTHYKSFNDMPVILINEYDDLKNIDKDFKFFDKKIEKLNIEWWLSKIKTDSNENLSTSHIKVGRLDLFFLNIHLLKIKFKNKFKKTIFTIFRKFHKKFSNLRKI